jgi:hypothetical protein
VIFRQAVTVMPAIRRSDSPRYWLMGPPGMDMGAVLVI